MYFGNFSYPLRAHICLFMLSACTEQDSCMSQHQTLSDHFTMHNNLQEKAEAHLGPNGRLRVFDTTPSYRTRQSSVKCVSVVCRFPSPLVCHFKDSCVDAKSEVWINALRSQGQVHVLAVAGLLLEAHTMDDLLYRGNLLLPAVFAWGWSSSSRTPAGAPQRASSPSRPLLSGRTPAPPVCTTSVDHEPPWPLLRGPQKVANCPHSA